MTLSLSSIVDPKIARKYALANAILHDGRADEKAVIGKVIAEDPSLKSIIKELSEIVKVVVDEVNKLSLDEQKLELESLAPELLEKHRESKPQELPPLPNVKDEVVMRLAPYPSGPLHIGNSRMVLLNDEYVKKYNGKLILMFDDTIGSEEKSILPEAYDQIRNGLDWLGVMYHETLYKSDRIPLFYEWADKLLRKGHAYVCECSYKQLRELRDKCTECEHRSRTPQENMDKWNQMIHGQFKEYGAVVRLKTRMDHPNPAFRDRVLLRVSDRKHPRVSQQIRVWPLLEFSWAVDDYVLGVTHVLRGKDLMIEDEMELAIWEKIGIKSRPEFVHYGILFFKEMELSKSKYRQAIEDGSLKGVDDPRTWTLESLRRRGIRPEAVRSFILSFGLSLTDVEVPVDNLYAENRRLIDLDANRYFFVPRPVEIEIENMPEIQETQAPVHPDSPERGSRILEVAKTLYVDSEDLEKLRGKDVRLKDLFNVRLDSKSRFLSMELRDIPKIQWLARGEKMVIVMPEGNEVEGLVEPSILGAKVGEVVQFERFGFVRIDAVQPELRGYFAHR